MCHVVIRCTRRRSCRTSSAPQSASRRRRRRHPKTRTTLPWICNCPDRRSARSQLLLCCHLLCPRFFGQLELTPLLLLCLLKISRNYKSWQLVEEKLNKLLIIIFKEFVENHVIYYTNSATYNQRQTFRLSPSTSRFPPLFLTSHLVFSPVWGVRQRK